MASLSALLDQRQTLSQTTRVQTATSLFLDADDPSSGDESYSGEMAIHQQVDVPSDTVEQAQISAKISDFDEDGFSCRVAGVTQWKDLPRGDLELLMFRLSNTESSNSDFDIPVQNDEFEPPIDIRLS